MRPCAVGSSLVRFDDCHFTNSYFVGQIVRAPNGNGDDARPMANGQWPNGRIRQNTYVTKRRGGSSRGGICTFCAFQTPDTIGKNRRGRTRDTFRRVFMIVIRERRRRRTAGEGEGEGGRLTARVRPRPNASFAKLIHSVPSKRPFANAPLPSVAQPLAWN